jgi:hypothetical protein
MPWLNPLLFVYAFLTASIGTAGYLGPLITGSGKGSVISMVAGFLSAGLILAGVQISKKNTLVGYGLCGLVCVGLIARFAGPFFTEGALYPAGIMVIISAVSLIGLAVGHSLSTYRS